MNPAIQRISKLCWGLAACGLISGCKSVELVYQDLVFQEVFYLSVRQKTDSSDPGALYNGNRGQVDYGVAMLALDHEDAFTRMAVAQPNRILEQTKRTEIGKVQQVQPVDQSVFLNNIKNYSLDPDPVQDILIFIHGFRKDFARNVTNAAQLRHELAFPGPVIAFSWPSSNSVTRYLTDLENVDWATPRLSELILDLSETLPHAKIHIVAHSIGNRALVGTLIGLQRNASLKDNWPIGEIIMLAPDLDRESFVEEISQYLKDIPSRITLYVSDSDFPLITAAQLFQYPRLGDSREGAPIIPGIETIDVSDAINITSGHGYYEESPIAIEDLYYLIHEGKGASNRPHIKEVLTEEGTYWRLQPAQGKKE